MCGEVLHIKYFTYSNGIIVYIDEACSMRWAAMVELTGRSVYRASRTRMYVAYYSARQYLPQGYS